MKLGSRGQFGPIGEDMMYFVMVIFAVAFILIISVNAFVDYRVRYAQVDSYRVALMEADKVAMEVACQYNDNGPKTPRVLNKTEIDKRIMDGADGVCAKYAEDSMGVCVRNKRTGDVAACGRSLCKNQEVDPKIPRVTIRLPVAIRKNEKDFDPGVLEVTSWK